MGMTMLESLYFVWGPEEFLIDEAIKNITMSFCKHTGEDPDLAVFYGDELNGSMLNDVLQYSPLFSMNRILIIKRIPWLTGKKRPKIKEDEIYEVIADYINNPNHDQIVIFTAEEYQNSNSIAKLLLSNCKTTPCMPLNRSELSAWVIKETKNLNQSINKEALALIASSKQNMYLIKNTLSKLSLINDGQEITKQDIEDNQALLQEEKVFKLIDAIMDKSSRFALSALENLLRQGDNPVYMLFMINRQFALLGLTKAYLDKGLGAKEISMKTGQKDFVIRNLAGKAAKFSWPELMELNKAFLETDILFKTTSQNAILIIEMLILGICSNYYSKPSK